MTVPAPRKKAGRPSIYHPSLGAAICERVANGEPLSHVLRGKNMPARMTFWNWTQDIPELGALYAKAREIQAHSVFDKSLGMAHELADKTYETAADERASYETAMKHFRWASGRLLPDAYSDKGTSGGAVQANIQINFSNEGGGTGEDARITVVGSPDPIRGGKVKDD